MAPRGGGEPDETVWRQGGVVTGIGRRAEVLSHTTAGVRQKDCVNKDDKCKL